MKHRTVTRSCVLAFAILFSGVILPVVVLCGLIFKTYVHAYLALNNTIALQAQYQREVTETPNLARDIQSLRASLSASKTFYEDERAETSTAKFGENIKEAVQQSGGTLRSESMNPIVQKGGLEKLEIGIDATLASSDLPRFLASLQAQRPVVQIESFNLSVAPFSAIHDQLWLIMKITASHRVPHA